MGWTVEFWRYEIEAAHLQILFWGFLPLLGHSPWMLGWGAHTCEAEDNTWNNDANGGVKDYFSGLTGWRKSTRTMRAESNPVCYSGRSRKLSFAITQDQTGELKNSCSRNQKFTTRVCYSQHRPNAMRIDSTHQPSFPAMSSRSSRPSSDP